MPPADLPNSAVASQNRKPKLLDEVRAVARMRHLSLRTEQAYANWIRRFILFHKKRHPAEMSEPEIREFISDLAVNGGISASTRTVALSALLFLHRDVLKKELPYYTHVLNRGGRGVRSPLD